MKQDLISLAESKSIYHFNGFLVFKERHACCLYLFRQLQCFSIFSFSQ